MRGQLWRRGSRNGVRAVRKIKETEVQEEPQLSLFGEKRDLSVSYTPFSSSDPFCQLFNQALGEVEGRYKPGATTFGFRKFPKTMMEILKLEDKMNDLWGSGKRDEDTLKEFRETLKNWYLQNLKVFEYYGGKKR